MLKVVAAEAGAWTPPAQFEEYRLLQELGHGAMGRVFLARDVLLDRLVAVKFILAKDPSPELRERFFTEARALARLQHPNVVAVYRVGEVQQRPYLISEYIRGQRLDQLARPLTPERVLEIAVALTRGLAAAHRVNILHRDIKPSNTLIADDGTVKLVDFGLAELVDGPRAVARLAASPPRSDGAGEDTLELPALVRKPRSESSASASSVSDSAKLAIGTPRYMAPELWRGEPATRATDVYSLGAVLFELCSGRTPFADIEVAGLAQHVQDHEAPSLASVVPALPPALVAILDGCLARTPDRRPPSADALLKVLEAQRARAAQRVEQSDAPPYPGLAAFSAAQRGTFFGRAADIRGIVERLRSSGIVFVAGDSGVGKSSICRAGVLPAIEDGALGARTKLLAVTPGQRPSEAILGALTPVLPAEVELRDPVGVARALRKASEGTPVLLFVDQLEELWTFAERFEADAALRLLGAIVQQRACKVVATIRSDFLTRLAGAPVLGEELASSLFLLRPLDEDSVREAIRGPAEAKGYRFESDQTVEALVSASQGSAGGLPLVQFALAALWDRRDEKRRLLPADALERLGGVEAALAHHADEVLASMPPDQRASAQRILCDLVTEEGTRRRRSEADLIVSDADRRAIQALIRGRLVVGSEQGGTTAQYEVAHEALLRGWDTLRGWLTRDEEKRVLRQRLERAAHDWERHGRGTELLWAPKQMEELTTAQLDASALPQTMAEFVRASRRALRRRRVTRWALLLGVPLLVGATMAGIRVRAGQELQRRVQAQLQQAKATLAPVPDEISALVRAHEAMLDAIRAGRLDQSEEFWSDVSGSWASIDTRHQNAKAILEGVLMLNPSADTTRELLAGIAHERARLLGRLARFAAAEDEARRALAYEGKDPDIRVPVSIVVSPAPTITRFERFTIDGERVEWTPPAMSLGELALEPGSYLLEMAASGHVTTRLAFLVVRDRPVHAEITLPRVSEVPQGFVFVPAGEFLFGSSEPDELRKGFYGTTPLHVAETGAYFMAKHEVTYADWFEYLSATTRSRSPTSLPAAADRAHTLRITEEDGVQVFRFATQGHEYSVRAGERLTYRDRSHHASHDWLRFPVAGISQIDAEGYLAWLSEAGKVPGARLCHEREWERAARGADSRLVPTGRSLAEANANIDVTYGRQVFAFGPDEVGSHPSGASPYGVADLAGNNWEIVRSMDDPPRLLMRGGAWYQGELTARSMNREAVEGGTRMTTLGFRVCADAQ